MLNTARDIERNQKSEVVIHRPNGQIRDKIVQDTLSKVICQSGAYNERMVRNEVDKIQVFDAYILIFCTEAPR